jgi:hypothetical protein
MTSIQIGDKIYASDPITGWEHYMRSQSILHKVIENAQSFISNGGYATWQFIPYLHNEHQLMECMKLSQTLNFKKFKLAKLYRTQTIAKHYKTGEQFDLLPTTKFSSVININSIKKTAKPENCMHLSMPSIYISAKGTLSRCCYFSKIDQFHTLKDLPTMTLNLNDKKCITSCG